MVDVVATNAIGIGNFDVNAVGANCEASVAACARLSSSFRDGGCGAGAAGHVYHGDGERFEEEHLGCRAVVRSGLLQGS